MRKIVHTGSRLAAVGSGVALLFMMLSVSVDVVLRDLDAGRVPGVIEYNEVALVGFVYLSLAYAQHRGGHVKTELVTRLLPFRTREALMAAGHALVLAVLLWLMVASAQEAYGAFQVREYRFGLARVPIWPARITIPVGVLLLVLELSYEVGDHLRDAVRGRPAKARP